jgi:hypothetical protein
MIASGRSGYLQNFNLRNAWYSMLARCKSSAAQKKFLKTGDCALFCSFLSTFVISMVARKANSEA